MEIEQQKQQKEISAEELQLYDRQRFIGIEVQKRLLNSLVLLTPLNGINTELAKNLILSGTNIVIADNEIINSDDVETNFLIAPAELGQKRGAVICKKLREMNPMVKIDLYDSFDIKQYKKAYIDKDGSNYEQFQDKFLNQFNIIASSVKQFQEMQTFESVTLSLNIPYYNLLCCGFSGFYYVNLGSKFEFIKKKPQKNVFKDGKKVEGEAYEEFEQVTITGVPQQNTFNCKRMAKTIQKAIEIMADAEKQGLVYDCFNPNEQIFNQIFNMAKEKFTFKDDQQLDALSKFIKFYGIEYCPVYSVIGSVASQEFIKVIGRDSEPGLNWFLYDSQDGYGKLENVQGDKDYQRKDLPELRRKIETDL